MTENTTTQPGHSVISLSLTVNGATVVAEVPGWLRLIELLRDMLRLTGTHSACESGQCGACTVLVNGEATKACSVLAASCDGDDVLTVEGLARNGILHPMQLAFRECHGLQCGFCTPGMIMSGIDIVRRLGPKASADLIRHELEGNLCRCTGYDNIVRAIQMAAAATVSRDDQTS